MKKSSIIILFSVLLLLQSCYSVRYVSAQNDFNQSYQCKTKTEIISTFGVPAKVSMIEGIGEILVYEGALPMSEISAEPGDCTYTQFFFNGNDVCYQIVTNQMQAETYRDKHKTAMLAGFTAAGSALIIAEAVYIILNNIKK